MSDLVNLLWPSAAPANPLWWDNPVGTETTLPGAELRGPSGALLDPVVGGSIAQPRTASQQASTRDLLRSAISTSVQMALGMGPGMVKGFHGTPHTFAPEPGAPLGRFADSAIGSGEGAQAYGYGHYVAGNRSVASSYMNAGEPHIVSLDGRPLKFDDLAELDNEPGADVALEYYSHHGFDLGQTVQAIKALPRSNLAETYGQDGITQYLTDMDLPSDPQAVANYRASLRAQDQAINEAQDNAVDWLTRNQHRIGPPPGGNLYHVEITPDEHELLDWDKPVGEQPHVMEFLKNFLGKEFTPSQYWSPEQELQSLSALSGENAYHQLSNHLGSDQKASAALHEAGIPGIKYLDQGSRGEPEQVLFAGDQMLHKLPSYHPGSLAGDMLVYNSVGKGKPLTQDIINSTADELSKRMSTEHFISGQWIKEHAHELEFRPNPTITRNYVIFHPSNLRIVGRNGEMLGLEPVDHDPFSETPQ